MDFFTVVSIGINPCRDTINKPCVGLDCQRCQRCRRRFDRPKSNHTIIQGHTRSRGHRNRFRTAVTTDQQLHRIGSRCHSMKLDSKSVERSRGHIVGGSYVLHPQGSHRYIGRLNFEYRRRNPIIENAKAFDYCFSG